MKNKILERRAALEAALSTVNYQIKNLKHLFSREQVRCWYVHRRKLKAELRRLPTAEQVKESARATTTLLKQIKFSRRPSWTDSQQNQRFK